MTPALLGENRVVKSWEVDIESPSGGGLAIDPISGNVAAGGKSVRVYNLKTGARSKARIFG